MGRHLGNNGKNRWNQQVPRARDTEFEEIVIETMENELLASSTDESCCHSILLVSTVIESKCVAKVHVDWKSSSCPKFDKCTNHLLRCRLF